MTTKNLFGNNSKAPCNVARANASPVIPAMLVVSSVPRFPCCWGTRIPEKRITRLTQKSMKLPNIHQQIAVLLFLVFCNSVNSNAQTSSEYSAHSVRAEGNILLIPIGFFAYDYRPLDYLSVAVGFGSAVLEDSVDIHTSGYMARASWLMGKNSKYFELGSGVIVADSKFQPFILASYRYQPVNGVLWGLGLRLMYVPPADTGQTQSLITILSLAGFSFQLGYAF